MASHRLLRLSSELARREFSKRGGFILKRLFFGLLLAGGG
jgi:hypothetical protein